MSKTIVGIPDSLTQSEYKKNRSVADDKLLTAQQS
jgi:hypothetical protein